MARSVSPEPTSVQRAPRESPQIFIKPDGTPVNFYILDIQDSRGISWDQVPLSAEHTQALRKRIEQHGGRLSDILLPSELDTLIVNEAALDDYQHYYHLNTTLYVEHPGFVAKCVEEGVYSHEVPAQKAMGGRQPGYKRVKYTEEDEVNMCKFLAIAAPDPAAGGRLGPGIWNFLMSFQTNPDYAWVKRHTAQSWQEHYKKNKPRLDPLIADEVARKPPPANGKGLYYLSRNVTKRNQLLEKMVDLDDDEEWEVRVAESSHEEVDMSGLEREEVEELVTPRKPSTNRNMSDDISSAEQPRYARHVHSILFAKQAEVPSRSTEKRPGDDREDESSDTEELLEIPPDFESDAEVIMRPPPREMIEEHLAEQETRSPAPSPSPAISRQPQHPLARSSPIALHPRLAERLPNVTFPFGSQITLVDPLATQPHASPLPSTPTPQKAAKRARVPSPALLQDRTLPSPNGSSRIEADVESPARKRRRVQVEVAVPYPSEIFARQRNHAASGTSPLRRLRASQPNEENGSRASPSDVEREVGPDDSVDIELEGAADSEEEIEIDPDVASDEEEIEIEPDVVSDEEGSAAADRARLPHTTPRTPHRVRVSQADDDEERLYPRLDDLRSSDDERTHQKLTRSHSRYGRPSSSKREARAEAADATPPAALEEQSEHHDFSASEADDEDGNGNTDDGSPPSRRSDSSPSSPLGAQASLLIRSITAQAPPLATRSPDTSPQRHLRDNPLPIPEAVQRTTEDEPVMPRVRMIQYTTRSKARLLAKQK